MKKIHVKLNQHSYNIIISRGALRALPRLIHQFATPKNFFVITNSTIDKLYGSSIRSLLSLSNKQRWIIIPDGEKYKNLATVEKIHRQIIRRGCDRSTLLVALGGGVVGDIAGFVAATLLRGVPFIQVPTTLLAQVDSSVGGKTGVDVAEGKNLVGAFYQPKAVLIDTNFLKTLPRREFLCGMAEVVKYGLLKDPRLFEYIEKNIGNILSLAHTSMEHLIGRSCAIKADIVGRDEKETGGLRATLNLGHTLAHAVETLSGYEKIRHGEAVSMGLVYAGVLSCQRGYASPQIVARIINVLKALGLPTQWPRFSKARYAQVIARDKKARGNQVKYISLSRIGKTKIVRLTPTEIVKHIAVR